MKPTAIYHSTHMRHGDFVSSRAHGYLDADWTWAKKHVRPDDVKVVLLAWDMEGRPAHRTLGGELRDFERRAHVDSVLKMAHAEAKRLLEWVHTAYANL